MTLHHTALMFEYALMGSIGIWLAVLYNLHPCLRRVQAFYWHLTAMLTQMHSLSLSFYYMFNAVYGPECV